MCSGTQPPRCRASFLMLHRQIRLCTQPAHGAHAVHTKCLYERNSPIPSLTLLWVSPGVRAMGVPSTTVQAVPTQCTVVPDVKYWRVIRECFVLEVSPHRTQAGMSDSPDSCCQGMPTDEIIFNGPKVKWH